MWNGGSGRPAGRTNWTFARAGAALLAVLLLATGRPAAADDITAADLAAEPFGPVAGDFVEGPILAKWQGVREAMAAEAAVLATCRTAPLLCPSPAARDLIALAERARGLTGLARAGEINRSINLDIRPTPDLDRHGIEDVWSSPLATLAAHAGDCEDYAIAKLAALREAGVPAADLRLVILREGLDDHAVAAVRIDGRWRVLDNRRLVMLEDSRFGRGRPLFVLSEDGVRRYPDEPQVVATLAVVQPYF
jgi:predicted transglutaminase-like cysteine proteinase